MAVISHVKWSQPFGVTHVHHLFLFFSGLLGRLLGLRGSVGRSRSKPVVY
jgi:hypothetical protein